MANRYSRKDVLQALYNKVLTACEKVYTASRPTATESMDKFIVIRLPQGIYPYADTHNTSYVQFICYTKDRQGGIENEDVIEDMVDSISSLFPFNDTLISCNDTPKIFGSVSDGLGFHSVIIQFKIVIKI